jgi:hypothetical protein
MLTFDTRFLNLACKTDNTTEHILSVLETSRVRQMVICSRRGTSLRGPTCTFMAAALGGAAPSAQPAYHSVVFKSQYLLKSR